MVQEVEKKESKNAAKKEAKKAEKAAKKAEHRGESAKTENPAVKEGLHKALVVEY